MHAEGDHRLAEFLQLFVLRFVVHPIDTGEVRALHRAGHLFIGGEHELFDQLMALVVKLFFDAVGVTFLIDVKFDRSHVEVERAVLEAALA